MFLISRDPPEGGTTLSFYYLLGDFSFQFLGIPPKGEHVEPGTYSKTGLSGFQFLGIPPKGEQQVEAARQWLKLVSNF